MQSENSVKRYVMTCVAIWAVAGIVLVMCGGCAMLTDLIKDLPDFPSEPGPEVPVSEPPANPGEIKVETIWTGPNGWKLGTVSASGAGLLWTIYRRPGDFATKIFLDGKELQEIAGAETITDFVEDKTGLYALTEHKGAWKWDGGEFRQHIPKTAGRWSCAGTVWKGKAVGGFNDAYSADSFQDSTKIYDLASKSILFEAKPKAFPIDMAEFEGALWSVMAAGDYCLYASDGTKIGGNFHSIEVWNGALWIGGGGAYTDGKPDGRIFQLVDGTPVQKVDTQASSVNDLQEWRGVLWFSAADPDTLGYVDTYGTFKIVWKDGKAGGGGTWDARCTVSGDTLYAGFSDSKNSARILKVTQ